MADTGIPLSSLSDVPWAPLPNSLVCTLGKIGPSPVSSVLLFLTCQERVLLVDVTQRGWDLPGGHVEEGEDVLAAAQRELLEEAGLVISQEMEVFGWLRLVCSGPLPQGYPYAPESTMLALRAHLEVPGQPPLLAPRLTEEVGAARWVPLSEAVELCAGRVWLPLLPHVRQ